MEIPINLLDEARAGRRGPALQFIRGQAANTTAQDCQKILDDALHPAPKDMKPERADAPEPADHDESIRKAIEEAILFDDITMEFLATRKALKIKSTKGETINTDMAVQKLNEVVEALDYFVSCGLNPSTLIREYMGTVLRNNKDRITGEGSLYVLTSDKAAAALISKHASENSLINDLLIVA
jgi:hypothetical protein